MTKQNRFANPKNKKNKRKTLKKSSEKIPAKTISNQSINHSDSRNPHSSKSRKQQMEFNSN